MHGLLNATTFPAIFDVAEMSGRQKELSSTPDEKVIIK